MDYNLLWLLTTACICGCYKNERNRPEEFQGHLAHETEEYIRPKSVIKPTYLHDYGNIITGKKYRITKAYVKLSFILSSTTQLLILYILIFFKGKNKLQITNCANLLEMKQIVLMIWQLPHVLIPVKGSKVGT